ncbi:uncharacterized protein [Scyliorhinus torazame]|uniref:uncharacterized protein n=1 Tax=Scyliorhinus torazame TaxID=75743 RepID=UPI003B5C8D7E
MDNQQQRGWGFQHATAEYRKGATDGHKKMKRNHKVTFLKCPQRKTHKRAKHYRSRESVCTDSSKDRSNPYGYLPIAPPLPEQSFWNQSDPPKQSVPKHYFSSYLTDSPKYPDITRLPPSKANNVKDYIGQLESLYPCGYSGQRSKNERVTTETSSPIMISINSHSHLSQLPTSEDNSTELTFNQADGLHGSSCVSSPLPRADIVVNGITTSPIQTMHSHPDSIQGTSSSPNQFSSTQLGNEPNIFNYFTQSEFPHNHNGTGVARSIKTLSPHNDDDVSHTSGQFVQPSSFQATDKTQGTAGISLWSQDICGDVYAAQDEGNHSHNVGDCKLLIKIPTTRVFHPTDKREGSIRSGSVKDRTDRHTRDRKTKSVGQQKLCPFSPEPSLSESIEYPYCYSESSKLSSNKPTILTSSILKPLGISAHNKQALHYSPAQVPHMNLKGYKLQGDTSSIKKNAQIRKSVTIPITRVIHGHHKRANSYNEPSVNQSAERQTGTRRSRSISPQKSHHNSLGSRPNSHFTYPYCFSEALTQDNGKHSLHSPVSDNKQHASKFSIQPLHTHVDHVQKTSNSTTPIKHNAQGACNSSGSVPCGFDGERQVTLESMSSPPILPPATHVDVSRRHATDFSIYSSCPCVADRMNGRSPIHLLSTGINNSSVKSSSTQHRCTESVPYFPTHSLSPHANKASASYPPLQSLCPCVDDGTLASYSPIQSKPTCFQDNVRDVSNSITRSVSIPIGNRAQGVPYSSNQSLPMHIGDNEKSTSHGSLPNHVGDKHHSVFFQLSPKLLVSNELQSPTQSNNVQHMFNSSLQSPSTDIDNTHKALPVSRLSISSNSDSNVQNASTLSSDHVVEWVNTASHPANNSLFIPVNNDKRHISNLSNHSPSILAGGVLQGTSNLLVQTPSTHVENNLVDNSRSFIQPSHLQAVGETQRRLDPSTQSPSPHVAAIKGGGTGLSIYSPTSRADSNKKNASNSVVYSLASNVDYQLSGANSPNYSPLPHINDSAETISKLSKNPQSNYITQAAYNLPIQSSSIHVDDSVQGVSQALSQSPSTSVGENRHVSQTFKPFSSSVPTHSAHDGEQTISSSSNHLLSTYVKGNALGKFSSSPKLLCTNHDKPITYRSTLCTPVAHNTQCTYSSATSPLILGQNDDISPIHPMYTSVEQSRQSASDSSSQVQSSHIAESIQDVATSLTQICTRDNDVRHVGSPSSLSAHHNTNSATHSLTQLFPHNIDNRLNKLHEVKLSVNSPPGFVHRSSRLSSTSVSSDSETEQREQTTFPSLNHSPSILITDNILCSDKSRPKSLSTYTCHGHQVPLISATQSPAHMADNTQAAYSQVNFSRNVHSLPHSSTTQQVFRPYVHARPPQVLHENTSDTTRSHSKSPSPQSNDQIVFGSSAQAWPAYINSNSQDASYYPQSLSTDIGDNLKCLSPPSPQLLYTHTENTRGDGSFTHSQRTPVSNKPQSVSYTSTHSKFHPVSNHLHGGSCSSINSTSHPGSNHLHGGSCSSIHSKSSSKNLHSDSYSSTRSKSSSVNHNLHNCSYSSTQSQSSPVNLLDGANSPTQSWSSSVSNSLHSSYSSNQSQCSPVNNLQGGSYSPTQSNPVSCSYIHTQSRSSGNYPQVVSCPSTHVDDRSDVLGALRPSKHSQSPHAFYSVTTAPSFPVHSSVSNKVPSVSRSSPKLPTYVGDDEQNPFSRSMYTHTDKSAQRQMHSSKFSQVAKEVEGMHHSYNQAYSSNASIKQGESTVPSSWHKYSKDLGFSSPAPSSSIFPSSTSPDDSSGVWSLSTHSLHTMSKNCTSSTSSSLIQSSPRSDDSTSIASGYTVTSLYDD